MYFYPHLNLVCVQCKVTSTVVMYCFHNNHCFHALKFRSVHSHMTILQKTVENLFIVQGWVNVVTSENVLEGTFMFWTDMLWIIHAGCTR